MSTHTTFSYDSADGVTVTAYRWDPAEEPVGIVQLTHGMGEHVLRYAELAKVLTARGLVVYGQDHRGHGATAFSPDRQGDLGPNGWVELVADIGRLTDTIRREHPDLPLLLLGHSMGSFAVQQYLVDNSARVDAAALSGTAAIDLLAPAMAELDGPVDLSAFNAPFAPARTDFDWLSRDPEQVDLYVDDPNCGFGIDEPSGKSMFSEAVRLAQPSVVAHIRNDLPLYIAVGSADPVNGGLALLDPLVERYKEAGLTDITLQVYPDARHEIFNETNRDVVMADLVAWTSKSLAL
ncbi:alpha/beta fold hydrolase [Pseudonocardia spinosispora]|uniref:alpha/beta fold hydrolase n=1 Tax=Pseudonocardia spinosispora TaxID=103441 RepID=UPI0003F4AFD7|nr:alpha/beta hydrolase [Pseudonocardia spinosispora]